MRDTESSLHKLNTVLLNQSRNRKSSFKLGVTLWVYGTKSQAVALVDSGATTSFINKSFVETNKLVTIKLATPYQVKNADGTLNKGGRITEAVKAYIEIGTHKHKQLLLVTDLGDEDMYIGYEFLYKHNPNINFATGEWEFTNCPKQCHSDKATHLRCLESDLDDILADNIEWEKAWISFLDFVGNQDKTNPFINWLDLDQPDECIQAAVLDDQFVKTDNTDEDTSQWKVQVPEWVHDFSNVFSKTKSERMPDRKEWDHPIEFEAKSSLPKPSKLYPLDKRQANSLDS